MFQSSCLFTLVNPNMFRVEYQRCIITACQRNVRKTLSLNTNFRHPWLSSFWASRQCCRATVTERGVLRASERRHLLPHARARRAALARGRGGRRHRVHGVLRRAGAGMYTWCQSCAVSVHIFGACWGFLYMLLGRGLSTAAN